MRFFVLVLVMLFANIAQGNDIDSCITDASNKYNIAPEIIRAIIKTESNSNPFAINVSGKGYYPDNRKNALEIISKNKSESFDVGIMQINKWWFDRFDYDYFYGLDPCFNIHLGSWILAYEISRHGYSWEAIGRYHSHTEKHKRRYINKIAGLLTNKK